MLEQTLITGRHRDFIGFKASCYTLSLLIYAVKTCLHARFPQPGMQVFIFPHTQQPCALKAWHANCLHAICLESIYKCCIIAAQAAVYCRLFHIEDASFALIL